MKDLTTIKLNNLSTIRQAMNAINEGEVQIAVVVDSHNKLVGIINDGDIRRALLNNYSLESIIEPIIQKNPLVCKKNETNQEILARTMGRKIYNIPVVDDENRFLGVKDIDSLLKQNCKENKIVIMAGGIGSRLRPLTENIPKPMIKVGNRPILETIINNFKQYGFCDFILSVNYKAEIVEKYFGDGKKFGVTIEYVYEEQQLGTAGALSLMKKKFSKPFFVMNADLLTNVNFEHFLDFHNENDSIATMAVREFEYQIPYGVINQKNGRIASIVEKPKQQFYVNAGIYILSPDVIKLIPKNTFFDMPTLFDDLIKHNKNPISFPVHEYWLDIGQIKQLEQAREDYFSVFESEA